jgi:hypothetical protein
MGSQLPIGTEPVATVARFNLWTLEWNARGFGPFRRGYWNAPIFSPARGAFAFSDPQPLTGAVFHVLTLVGIGATVAYALILLGALTLNGIAASQLLDGLGVAFAPASLGGALMVALPFVANEFGVLQLMMVFPILFGLDALFRYFRRPDWQPAAMVGVWVAVSFLTSEYYAYFLLFALAIVTVVMVVKTKPHVAHLAHAAIAAGVALLLAGPFLAAQSSRIRGYAWPRDVVADLGAYPRDWFRLHASALGSHLPLVGTAHGTQLALYPGTMLLVLAYFGLAGIRRNQLRWVVGLIAVAVVASLLADGFGLDLFGWAPYEFLRDHLPGLSRIRSPYRFAVLTQVCLALLAGLGLGALWRWWRRWGAILAIALTALAIIEVALTPLHTEPAIPGHNADWVSYVSDQPVAPVAMIPFPASPSSVDYADTTTAMLLGLEHDHPLVNGYSGFFPARYIDLRKDMAAFPSAPTVEELRDLHVRNIVVDNVWLTDERAAAMQDLGFTAMPAFAGEDRSVYAVPKP